MKNIYLSFLFFSWLNLTTAASQESNVLRVKTLIEKIEEKTSVRPGWDEPATVVDNRHILKAIPEFLELKQSGNKWPELIKNIQEIAPSRMSKTILFVSFQSLPTDEYLEFLNEAVGLAETNILDKRQLKWALFPSDKNVRGVLDYNYEKPVVKDILQRVKVLYASEPNMVKYCDATLSGKTKQEVEAYFNANPREPRSGPALSNGTKSVQNTELIPDRTTPDLATQSASKTSPTITLETKPQTQTSSNIPLVVGILLLLAVAGFVFFRRKS